MMRLSLFLSGFAVLLLTATPRLLFAATPVHTSVVQGVQSESEAGVSRIILQFDRFVGYKSGRLTSPERLYVDLLNVAPGPKWIIAPISPDDAFVKQLRASRRAPNTTRLVVDLKLAADVSLVELENPPRLIVTMRPIDARDPALGKALSSAQVPFPNRPLKKISGKAAEPSNDRIMGFLGKVVCPNRRILGVRTHLSPDLRGLNWGRH